MTELDDELRSRILSARALPSPPAVTARLIQLCEDPEAGISDVLDVLTTDQNLAARLMRLANTPIYARRRRTENLHQAVTLLGFDVVLTASLSLTLAAGRNAIETRSPQFRKRQWARSVHAATCAQLIAEKVRYVDPTDAFLAALLQDIGVQVVDRIEPTAYERCDPFGTHDDLVAAEIEHLGVDHSVLGAFLLEEWRLPGSVVNAVKYSHEPTDPDATTMAAVCTVAGRMADGFSGQDGQLDAAFDEAESLLGIDEATFTTTIEYIASVLPDLAAILDADAPDMETLAERAEEAIVIRQMHAQAATVELHEEVRSLRTEAEQLKTQSTLDALTGLVNRRGLDEILEREFSAARRNGFPISILFVDLDDFKLVNDRYGHSIGDELLTQAARRISGSVRDGDFVGRFGGEEFVVVLPGADIAASDAVAHRLVESFAERPFAFADELQLGQTTSVGVATRDEDTAFDSVSEMLHTADLALYVAKRSGKNQFQRGDAPADAVQSAATPSTAASDTPLTGSTSGNG